jgi:hypothetical protein
MKWKIILLCVLLTIGLAATTAAKDQKKDKKQTEDFTKHPGYVDFDALKIFEDEDAKVEVYLKQPMLKLLSEFGKHEDPEMFDLFSRLYLVRVQVFESTRALTEKFDAESSKTIKELDRRGWERVVRVREDEERVYVYLKPSEDYEYIQGIVVIAIEDFDEAVFVNIVGDIRPDDIGKLSSHFDIEELDSIRYEVKKGN